MARKPITRTKPRRREMLTAMRIQRISYISLLWSLGTVPGSTTYKHSIPTGLVVLAFGVVFVCAISDSHVLALAIMETPQGSATNYSKFKHDDPKHARLPCLLCHRRETNSPRPVLPGSNGHLPCAGCHAQQFANSTGPICTICHTGSQAGAGSAAGQPRWGAGTLKPFPRLSSFNMKFDHARHTGIGNVSCATCHRPSRGRVAMTIPSGFNAHATCYQCHGPGAKSGDKQISSCSVCHELGNYVRTRETAQAFRLGFSHAKHDKSEGLNCNECHRVRAGVARRVQVSAPQPLNHHASPGAFSCMSCHNGKRAFGGDDFSVCTRCHTKTTWHF
jgi:hypothetical protein